MMATTGYTHLATENSSGSVPVAAGVDHAVLPFSDSHLQTVPPSETHGKITGTFRPPSDADDSFSKPGSANNQGDSEPSGWQRFFSVAAYKPYFNVDTVDVLERIGASLFPFRGNFFDKTSDNPDVYGPFWICTTLIFVAASLGNFAAFLAQRSKNQPWHYDINQVTWSAGMFYGYVALVPTALYFLLKYLGVMSVLVQLQCLYGYSIFIFIPASCLYGYFIFIFIPASFLSVIPVELFRWVIVGSAGLLSATFLGLNIRKHIQSQSDSWLLIVAGAIVLQLALALVMKLYFFTFFFA